VAAVIGILVPVLGWVAAAIDGAVLVAIVVDVLRARAVLVSAQRRWPPLLVQGAAADIDVLLEASSPTRLEVRDALHPALADAPRRTALDMTAGGALRWRYRVTPRRRGEHEAGAMTARVLGPWRLAWHQRQLAPAERRRVYPQIRWEGRVGHLLVLAHRRALGARPARLRGLGTEPYSLREYRPGDPLDKIHWKATARHGRLVSREDTWEKGSRLIILLDCARGMSGMDGERSKLDHALAAALALTRVASARGDRVTLAAFDERVRRSVRLRGGQRAIHTAYGALYDLESQPSEPAYDLAAETATQLESRRSTVVLFTSVVDLAAAELLREALVRLRTRHLPILINLEDPELVTLAHAAPATAADAFAKVSALDILLANRSLASRLRHAGIRVMTTAADRLALETLEAYLETLRVRAA